VAGTLTPDSADEATTLIPSLAGKLDNETLQPLLDELTKMRMLEKVRNGGEV
jgi:DNA-directed RNA polymerase II subunit RPB4|tara:strand:+ start:9956 stop:10111 length:156 start_codon:yes stop_codon:yes gene_type:complete